MKTGAEVREFAAKQNQESDAFIAAEEAEKGMAEMSRRYRDKGEGCICQGGGRSGMKHVPTMLMAGILACLPASASAQAFIAVVTTDHEASARWYTQTFGLERVNAVDGDGYAMRLLEGATMIVEIIGVDDPPAAPDRAAGLFKAGAVIADFDTTVARWREAGVPFFGNGQIFTDEALGRKSVILLDPDGNRVQLFSGQIALGCERPAR